MKSLYSVGGCMECFIFIKLKELSSHSTKPCVCFFLKMIPRWTDGARVTCHMAESLTLLMLCRLTHANCQQEEGGRETESDPSS